jgi:hypothetical protein
MRSTPIDFKITDDGCFEVISHKSRTGYPEIMINRVTKKIHRHIFEECFGEIPAGLVIRHKCDNPFCINPEHLETGTHADNVRDQIKRHRHAKGSRKALSKLIEHDIVIIRRMSDMGYTNRSISKIFNVDETVISEIKNRKAWKHVEEEKHAE